LSEQSPSSTDSVPEKAHPPRRRWRKRLVLGTVAFLVVLTCTVLAAPWIVAETPLRNVVLNAVLADRTLDASADELDCGWLSPLSIRGMRVQRVDERLHVEVERLQFEKSWFLTWLNVPHIGRAVIDTPRIDLIVPPDGLSLDLAAEEPEKEKRPQITLSAVVKNGLLRIGTPEKVEPVIVLDDLNLEMRIADTPNGRFLTVQPFTVFAGEDVTSELCDQGLQLVAPVLSDAMRVEGQVTLSLNEVSLPLDIDDSQERSQRTSVGGRLQLNHVKTGLKSPLLQQIANLASSLLKVQVPQTVQIADDTEVVFELRDGRVFHEGLVFWLPEISKDIRWQSSGTVGLDESLDLIVQAQLPLTLIHDGPLTQRLSDRPFEFHIVGTLDQPKLELFKDRSWVTELVDVLTSKPAPGGGQDTGQTEEALAESILDAVGRAVDELSDPDRLTPVLDRIRERREERQKKKLEKRAEDEQAEKPKRGLFRGGLFRTRDRSRADEP